MADENEVQYMNELEDELRKAQKERREIAKAQLSMYGEYGGEENNLVKWQLNLEEEKERIYHLLKGDRKTLDENKNEVWVAPETTESIILNDYGVDYIMGLLESFLNRNIILSNFDEPRIMEICNDLGTQIIEDIYNDYEKIGLNTDDKRKKAAILVWKVLINVEAALRRAMGGRENLNLRKIITVSQNENPRLMNQEFPVVSSNKQRKLMHPSTW